MIYTNMKACSTGDMKQQLGETLSLCVDVFRPRDGYVSYSRTSFRVAGPRAYSAAYLQRAHARVNKTRKDHSYHRPVCTGEKPRRCFKHVLPTCRIRMLHLVRRIFFHSLAWRHCPAISPHACCCRVFFFDHRRLKN